MDKTFRFLQGSDILQSDWYSHVLPAKKLNNQDNGNASDSDEEVESRLRGMPNLTLSAADAEQTPTAYHPPHSNKKMKFPDDGTCQHINQATSFQMHMPRSVLDYPNGNADKQEMVEWNHGNGRERPVLAQEWLHSLRHRKRICRQADKLSGKAKSQICHQFTATNHGLDGHSTCRPQNTVSNSLKYSKVQEFCKPTDEHQSAVNTLVSSSEIQPCSQEEKHCALLETPERHTLNQTKPRADTPASNALTGLIDGETICCTTSFLRFQLRMAFESYIHSNHKTIRMQKLFSFACVLRMLLAQIMRIRPSTADHHSGARQLWPADHNKRLHRSLYNPERTHKDNEVLPFSCLTSLQERP